MSYWFSLPSPNYKFQVPSEEAMRAKLECKIHVKCRWAQRPQWKVNAVQIKLPPFSNKHCYKPSLTLGHCFDCLIKLKGTSLEKNPKQNRSKTKKAKINNTVLLPVWNTVQCFMHGSSIFHAENFIFFSYEFWSSLVICYINSLCGFHCDDDNGF